MISSYGSGEIRLAVPSTCTTEFSEAFKAASWDVFSSRGKFLNSLLSSTWPGMSLRTCRGLCLQKAHVCRACQNIVQNCIKAHSKFTALSTTILPKINDIIVQVTNGPNPPEQEIEHVQPCSRETMPLVLANC